MKKLMISVVLMTGVSGCADMASRLGFDKPKGATAAPAAAAQTSAAVDADGVAVATAAAVTAPATAAAPPPAAARSAEALDTTTPEQRKAAAAPVAAQGKVLGKTIASLGSPTEPGLWLKTPLVKAETQGRVTNPATGKSSAVTLLPLGGPATAGSQMSLAALRLVGASLTDLTEVEVSTEG